MHSDGNAENRSHYTDGVLPDGTQERAPEAPSVDVLRWRAHELSRASWLVLIAALLLVALMDVMPLSAGAFAIISVCILGAASAVSGTFLVMKYIYLGRADTLEDEEMDERGRRA